MGHFHASSTASPARPGVGIRVSTTAFGDHKVCSLMKTMSGARIGDNGAWCVMSLLRVSSWDISMPTLLAAWFPCGMPWVVVFLGVAYLCSLDTSSPWSTSAATTLADTLPSLCWRMLCRPNSLGLADTSPPLLLLLWRMLCHHGCTACWSSPADALPPWCCYF